MADNDQRKYLYLAGIGVTHSVAAPMHDFIAKSLNLPWEFLRQECPTVESMMEHFRAPTFAGGVVTMPYKKAVMAHLDGLDELAITLGACNNVYRIPSPDGSFKLRGTNTDWLGVRGCLLHADVAGQEKPALIIGAGGAARAAVYALSIHLRCPTIYVINRDAGEVADLLKDSQAYGSQSDPSGTVPNIVHVESVAQAQSLERPFYVVGTVPDIEPKAPEELLARDILTTFLTVPDPGSEKPGVLLDMCFKPRETRTLKLGKRLGWKPVEGVEIIGHQIEHQWRLWAGEEAAKHIPVQEAWAVLFKAAEESPAINF